MAGPLKRIDIVLQPGEYFVGKSGHSIRTILGSCVSITLWHPGRKVGAMSHSLLPSRGSQPPGEFDARYGNEAMQLMLKELKRLDIRPEECKGKIFGGANMFPGQSLDIAMRIGWKNGQAARDLLQAHRIEVVSESLYGTGHRQIIFNVDNGDVWVRQVRLQDSTDQRNK